MEENNTNIGKVPKFAIPLWFLYMLASLSILQKYSVIFGVIMIACGVLMALYSYAKDKTGVVDSWSITNMPIDDIVFKHYISLLLRNWKIALIVWLLIGVLGYVMAVRVF